MSILKSFDGLTVTSKGNVKVSTKKEIHMVAGIANKAGGADIVTLPSHYRLDGKRYELLGENAVRIYLLRVKHIPANNVRFIRSQEILV